MPLKTGFSQKTISSNIMTDHYGHFLIFAIVGLALHACTMTRDADLAILGEPPARLQGDIVTMVDWRDPAGVMWRCAAIQAEFMQIPTGGHGCAYARPDGEITLVLPKDLHPLIVHEIAHAHQLRLGEPIDHRGWK